MKAFLIAVSILTLTTINSGAQNLVLNPGLDNFITCPGFGQFGNTFIYDWTKPSIGSSDYYNFNCPAIPPALEFPYDGEAYAGVIAYNFGTEYREYITGTLMSPLLPGMSYEVSFFVSLHNGYIQAVEEMGAYFSNTVPGPFPNALHIAVTPQIINTTGALDDTTGWRQIYGIYTATGGESYITIGNFFDDTTTTITQPYSIGSFGAYYFVDGVSVTPMGASGISNSGSAGQIQAWIANDELNCSVGTESDYNVELLDVTGKIVMREQITGQKTSSHQIATLGTGMYLIRITTASGTVYFRKQFISKL